MRAGPNKCLSFPWHHEHNEAERTRYKQHEPKKQQSHVPLFVERLGLFRPRLSRREHSPDTSVSPSLFTVSVLGRRLAFCLLFLQLSDGGFLLIGA
jgi:hypothetical protein